MNNSKYEIKNAHGEVVYSDAVSDVALSHYYVVRNKTGYAEVWYNGWCLFKTE